MKLILQARFEPGALACDVGTAECPPLQKDPATHYGALGRAWGGGGAMAERMLITVVVVDSGAGAWSQGCSPYQALGWPRLVCRGHSNTCLP